MISAIISRVVILLFGTLYPAYASYKAVRTKNVKEYVKWMMYWIVFAFFTCIETFTDILFSWFPFYYEIKVIIVLWLLSPATRGSSTLYRKFVHPMLTRREQDIDDYINQAKEKGYTAVLQLGSKGVNYATNVIMQTAIKAFNNPHMKTSMSDFSLSSYDRRALSNGNDTIDGGFTYEMRRTNSVESALNNFPKTNILYEIESEDEAFMSNIQSSEVIEIDMFDQIVENGLNQINEQGIILNEEIEEQPAEGSARARSVSKRNAGTTKRKTAKNKEDGPSKTTRSRRKRVIKEDEEEQGEIEIE